MKNFQKVLVAGGAGLLLGITSMTTHAQRTDIYSVTPAAQSLADSMGDACYELMFSSTLFIGAINGEPLINGKWDRLTDTSLITNDADSNATLVKKIEKDMSDSVQAVGCARVDCTVEVFDTSLTSSPAKTSLTPQFLGAKEDGDVALMCQVIPTSVTDSCDVANFDNVVFMLMPVSKRKDTINTTTNIGIRDAAPATNSELAFVIPGSGTPTGLSEDDVDSLKGYLSAGSRCGTTKIKILHNGNATSPFLSGNVYWTSY